MPGSLSNRNATRHGLRAGALPKGCAYIKRIVDELRRRIEAAVVAEHGAIPLVAAASINTATRWERHALLAQRWLRLRADEMSDDQRLAYSRDVAKASAERDKALATLRLPGPGDSGDPWAALHDRRGNGQAVQILESAEPDDAEPADEPPDVDAEPDATPPGLNLQTEAESADTPSPNAQ
jgi:hypothetical protein